MKGRDVITGFIVLVVFVIGVLLIKRAVTKNKPSSPTPTPTISQKIDSALPGLNIPAGVARANLSDVTGGNSLGVATRTEVVANLPALPKGKFYEAWLGSASGKTVLLGSLVITKSGYMIQYDSSRYPGYDKVFVTSGGEHILEGSF